MRPFHFIFILLFAVSSCSPFKVETLIGDWQADAVLESNIPLEVDVSEISFSFHEDLNYDYYSTIGYSESGQFQIDKNLLITKDTTRANASEKKVQILILTQDSLHIKMNNRGKLRIMQLYRK